MMSIYDHFAKKTYKGRSLESLIRRVYGKNTYVEYGFTVEIKGREGTTYDAWVWKIDNRVFGKYPFPVAPISMLK